MQLGDGEGGGEMGGGWWQECGEVARSTHLSIKGHIPKLVCLRVIACKVLLSKSK